MQWDFDFKVLMESNKEVGKCHPHSSIMTQVMFSDDDFDYEALLDDDILSICPSSTFEQKQTEKGKASDPYSAKQWLRCCVLSPQVYRSRR